MGSQTICCPSTLPSYNDLSELLSPFYSVPDVTLPTQITVPSPVWPDTHIPQAELEVTITEMLQSQMTGMVMGLLEPVTKYLGLNIEDVVPDIPGFPGINIINLVEGSVDPADLAPVPPVLPDGPSDLVKLVPDPPALPEGTLAAMVALASQLNFDFSAIPLLPSPIYPGLEFPARQALAAVQTAVGSYLQILLNVITDLINMVTDILGLPGLSISTFPTLDDIMALLPPPPSLPSWEELRALLPDLADLAGAPSLPSLEDILAAFPDLPGMPSLEDLRRLLPGLPGVPSLPTLDDLFDISIPGFSFKLELPSPLIPNINIPAYDFLQGLKNLYSGLTTEVLGIIVDFVESLPLPFEFPIFCLPIVTPDLPDLTDLPDLPALPSLGN